MSLWYRFGDAVRIKLLALLRKIADEGFSEGPAVMAVTVRRVRSFCPRLLFCPFFFAHAHVFRIKFLEQLEKDPFSVISDVLMPEIVFPESLSNPSFVPYRFQFL